MNRTIALTLGVTLLFTATCAVMIHFMPAPLKDSDYVVIGSVATLVSLLGCFFGLVGTSPKGSETFFKRRKKR
jgi:hypothetical protein